MNKALLTKNNWQKFLFQKSAPQSGFLLLNKPQGPTSHKIIKVLRQITGIKKIGHSGTLDPLASGLLIVAVGREATKQLSSFIKLNKIYQAQLRLGAVSNTFDREGKITKVSHPQKPSQKKIACVLKNFLGEQKQIPPMFSAKKIKGQKLYHLARQGITIKRKPHRICVDYLKILNYKWPDLKLETRVSSGTYIRSLANEIGQKLGCGAYLQQLKRLKIGNFSLKKAVKINLEK